MIRSSMNARVALVVFTLRQIFLSKKFVAMLILASLPLLLIIYAMHQPDLFEPFTFYSDVMFILYTRLILLLVTLLNGTSLIRDEISNKTISYLATRSLSRRSVVIGRYIGYVLPTYCIVAVPVTFSYIIVSVYKGGFGSNINLLASYLLLLFIGVLVYGAFFNLLGTMVKHPLMIGLLFAFIWEVFFTNLSGRIPNITIMYYLRSIAASLVDVGDVVSSWNGTSLFNSFLVLLSVTLFFLLFSIHIFSQKDVS
ncbi:MAG: ABC transporter permease [Candidatus Methanofastidiosia archaeon]